MGLPKKVAIVYSDVRREYFPTREQYLTEKDSKNDAALIGGYVARLGIAPFLYSGGSNLALKLKNDKPDVVINLVDSIKGIESLSSAVPGVLELLDIPYTGADILGKSLDGNKFLIKKLFQQNGIPIPSYQLFNSYTDDINPYLRFPLISKLNEIHGAVEINEDAVSEDERHLRVRLKYLIKTYKQPVLVEEFIVGREVTAILLEGYNKKVYLAEKVFNKPGKKYLFATFNDQWKHQKVEAFFYKKYSDSILREYVKKAFDTAKMYDYGKFDIRVDQSGRYFFIDSNCNPAFGPKEADVAISTILDKYGIDFLEILKRLLLNTMRDAQGRQRLPVV